MTEAVDVTELARRISDISKKVETHNKYFAVAFAVGAVFGLTGAWGYSTIKAIEDRLSPLQTAVREVQARADNLKTVYEVESDRARTTLESLANTKKQEIESLMAKKRESIGTMTAAVLPRGTILPLFALVEGSMPTGFVLCGTNGTPDLRNRYLFGAESASQAAQPYGEEKHHHPAIGSTGLAREGKTDGFAVQDDRKRSPQATGFDHYHPISNLQISDSPHFPPSVKVLFMCKF